MFLPFRDYLLQRCYFVLYKKVMNKVFIVMSMVLSLLMISALMVWVPCGCCGCISLFVLVMLQYGLGGRRMGHWRNCQGRFQSRCQWWAFGQRLAADRGCGCSRSSSSRWYSCRNCSHEDRYLGRKWKIIVWDNTDGISLLCPLFGTETDVSIVASDRLQRYDECSNSASFRAKKCIGKVKKRGGRQEIHHKRIHIASFFVPLCAYSNKVANLWRCKLIWLINYHP